jgi:2-haloacid dehalogenase
MSGSPRLANIKACVFDAYGTLFDVNAAAEQCRDAIGDKADDLARLWRSKQLEYTWQRSLRGDYEDFWHVTGDALDHTMATLGLEDPALRARLMEIYFVLDAYPEVAEVLGRLKAAGQRTAILSNGSPSMLIAAVRNAALDGVLDRLLSVDRLQIYKPHPSVYQLAVDELGIPVESIAFMSSNAWDASAAAAFGMQVVWINRFGARAEVLPGELKAEIRSLSELPALLGL